MNVPTIEGEVEAVELIAGQTQQMTTFDLMESDEASAIRCVAQSRERRGASINGARGKDIFLIGGGNSAGEAAMFFSACARTVTLLVRGKNLASSAAYYLIERLATKVA